MIYIIDYEAGNLRSVQKAIENCGVDATVTSDPNDVKKADKLILPGVGHFGQAIQDVKKHGFYDPIQEFVKSGKPFLGICVGLQLMFETSEESPGETGLSLFKGSVKRFPMDAKVPHLGWNILNPQKESVLWKDIPENSYFYFAHSFYIEPVDQSIVAATSDYCFDYAVAIQHENIYGLQFHPEKSQKCGLKVLENFVNV